MYVYNVTLKVNAERADEWIQWMKHEHIPEVLATGIFSDYRMCRLLDDVDSDGSTFVMQYVCNTLNDFETYKAACAPMLQRKHFDKFGQDVFAFRTVMEVL